MAATARLNKDLMDKYSKLAHTGSDDPIENLRFHCLARGASGIKGIGRWVLVS